MQVMRSLTSHCSLSHEVNGLPLLTIDNAFAKARVSLFGAHVLSYQRHGEPASIWLSDKAVLDGTKPIRGGIPVCWPWFGQPPVRVGSGKPAHGFARTTLWTLDGVSDCDDGTFIRLSMRDSGTTHVLWPHSFKLELEVMVGKVLSLVLTTRNTSDTPIIYNAALHSYLRISAPENVSVTGLGEFYTGILIPQEARQSGELRLCEAIDRIYHQPEAMVTVRDGKRITRVVNSNNDSVVVWTPWQEGSIAMSDMSNNGYCTMLCVETAITGKAGVTIAAEDEHSFSTTII